MIRNTGPHTVCGLSREQHRQTTSMYIAATGEHLALWSLPLCLYAHLRATYIWNIYVCVDQLRLSIRFHRMTTALLSKLIFDDFLIWRRFWLTHRCHSKIGHQGGAQEVSIGSGCDTKGVVMHELLHALGFWHEHSRYDRDNYIVVHTDNVVTGKMDKLW